MLTFADASHRYQTLQLTEGSPKLPYGYLTLAPLLFVPPLWRKVMHPVLYAYWDQWAEEDRALKDSDHPHQTVGTAAS